MKDTKLIRFLVTLDAGEMKAFQKFARSPYHNSNKQLIGLLDCLAKYHPSFGQKTLTKRAVYQKMHPVKKDYHEGRMNLLMAQLVHLFREFLAFEQVQKDAFLQRKYRLQALLEKRLDDEYQKEVKKQGDALEDWREDEHYHLERLLMNWQLFHHPATARHQVGMPSLDHAMESLDRFFVWSKLKLSAAVFNRERVFSEKHRVGLLENLLEEFDHYIENVGELNIYRKIIYSQTYGGKNVLSELVAGYIKKADHFSGIEKSKIFIYINNICAQITRQGNSDHFRDMFKLYKYNLSNISNGYDNYFTEFIFVNIAAISSVVNEFDWAENFIKNYKLKLHKEVREEAVSLAYANVYYQKAIKNNDDKSFTAAINYLSKIDTNRPFYFYRIKLLLLRIHYEYYLKKGVEYSFLIDYSHAFEKQIKRENKMVEQKKQSFLNFIIILRKIINAVSNPNFSADDKEMLLKTIKLYNNISTKQWLLEKIRELKTTP